MRKQFENTHESLFQHPFIRDACDRKPLLDLLAEFKAEIINEEEMDIEEEVRKKAQMANTSPH